MYNFCLFTLLISFCCSCLGACHIFVLLFIRRSKGILLGFVPCSGMIWVTSWYYFPTLLFPPTVWGLDISVLRDIKKGRTKTRLSRYGVSGVKLITLSSEILLHILSLDLLLLVVMLYFRGYPEDASLSSQPHYLLHHFTCYSPAAFPAAFTYNLLSN